MKILFVIIFIMICISIWVGINIYQSNLEYDFYESRGLKKEGNVISVKTKELKRKKPND